MLQVRKGEGYDGIKDEDSTCKGPDKIIINDLFEDLRKEADLHFISDIKVSANKNLVIQAIERLQAENYDSLQWRNLIVYILKSKL